MTTINRNINTTSVDCGTGHSTSDTCYITCNYIEDNSGLTANCGDAGKCYIDCDEQKCLRDGIINATFTNSLEIFATGRECVKGTQIYLPYNGNATIIVDTQGLTGMDGIIKQAIIHSQSTDYIHVECNDPLNNDNTKDICKELDILAADATHLSVTINGADFYNGAIIECPTNSILEPSCIINATNNADVNGLIIQAGNGTVPKDVQFYGGTGTSFSNIKFWCENGQQSIQYDTTIGTFNGTGVCWVNPTQAPTTSIPTTSTPTTNNPTTSIPTTSTPTTTNPTTYIPTTYNPTTVYPTTSIPTTITPTTDNPTTTNPTITNSPTTNSPTTYMPTTSTMSEIIFKTTNDYNGGYGNSNNNGNGGFAAMIKDPMMISLMVGALIISWCCAVLICFFFCKYKNKKQLAAADVQMSTNNNSEWNMTSAPTQPQKHTQYEGDVTTNNNSLKTFEMNGNKLNNNNYMGQKKGYNMNTLNGNQYQNQNNYMRQNQKQFYGENTNRMATGPPAPPQIAINNDAIMASNPNQNRFGVQNNNAETPHSPLASTVDTPMDMTPIGVVDTLSMMVQKKEYGNDLEMVEENDKNNYNNDKYYDDEQVINDMENENVFVTPGNIGNNMGTANVLVTPGNIGNNMSNGPPGPPPEIFVSNNEMEENYNNNNMEQLEAEDTDSYDMYTPVVEENDNEENED